MKQVIRIFVKIFHKISRQDTINYYNMFLLYLQNIYFNNF